MFKRFAKPNEKENKNYGFVFHSLRYFSFWLSIPFVFLPFSPNQITLLTNILQVISVFVVAYADGYHKLYGVLIYFIGGIFDFVDGNIARYKSKISKKGKFYDQIGHVFVGPLFYVGIGLAAYNNTLNVNFLYMTILIAMFVPLMSYQISVSSQYYKSNNKKTAVDDIIDKSNNHQLLFIFKKIISGFYHFKIEILVLAILLNLIEVLAILSTIYFISRFFLQLFIDQKNIT